MAAIEVYGIRQCDTCRKALRWLEAAAAAHRFTDLRDTPVAKAELARWWAELGDGLVNRRSTTWRQLDAAQRQLGDPAALLHQYPTLVKRPLVRWPDGSLTTGFDETAWQQRIEP